MKTGIHPRYRTVKIHCACGNTWETRSTADDLHLDICAMCHPFFTGKQKLIDTEGRVDRFRKKYAKTTEMKAAAEQKASDKAAEQKA